MKKTNKIDGKTKIVGLIAYPIEHTLSPSMHNAAFEYLGLNFTYVPFPVRPEFLKLAINGMTSLNICGLNVTIPHKENVIKYLDNVDGLAKKIGAVNTIVNTAGGHSGSGYLAGYNTDAIAFLKSLGGKFNLGNKRIFLFGAGGVAKAIGYALLTKKVSKIFITDIRQTKAKELVKKLGKRSWFVPYNQQAIRDTIRKIDMFINVTPVGMKKSDPCVINPQLLHKKMFIYDVIYNRKTELVKVAKSKRLPYLDGVDMFVHQGAVAFEYWTKKKAPLKIMYRVVRKEVSKN